MIRIGNQTPAQPVSTTSQPASAPAGSLQSLLASLEQAIQRLQHQQGGSRAGGGGGDRVETAPQPPTHRYHPPSHFPRWEPTKPPSTGPTLPPVVKLPEIPQHACGAVQDGQIVRKGLAGGTVGT